MKLTIIIHSLLFDQEDTYFDLECENISCKQGCLFIVGNETMPAGLEFYTYGTKKIINLTDRISFFTS